MMLTMKMKPNFQDTRSPDKAWGHPITAGKKGSIKGRDWHKYCVLNTCSSLPQQFWLRYGCVLTLPHVVPLPPELWQTQQTPLLRRGLT